MKYSLFFLYFAIISCTQNSVNIVPKASFSSKGFAYVYNNSDYENKTIKGKLDNESFQVAHYSIKPGALIRIVNVETKEEIILKNSKRFQFPDFYKILITEPVASKINLNYELPLVEVSVLKKNKSFVAKKTKIYKEEEKIHSNAPVEIVKIDNISKNKQKKQKTVKKNFYIVIGDFYSKKSINLLKDRIKNELSGYDSKKLSTNSIKTNKIRLLSGPYNSINLMKNDYIQLKKFGFEELDITLYE